MEYEVKEYLNLLIGALEQEEFFEQCPIRKDLLREGFLNKMESNLYTRGDYHLTDADVNDVWEEVVKQHIGEMIAQALNDGDLKIAGVDSNGELLYEIPIEQTQMVTAKFERLGPYGTYCLN